MKRALPVIARLLLGAAVASLMWPMSTRASVLSGCVAPEDAGVTHLIGWVDIGVMLGTADAEPPALLQVTDPIGQVIVYRDGLGLIAPTDVLPIWFAPAEINGDYELVVDGLEACRITVGDESGGATLEADEIEGDWVPHSAPITRS